MDSPILNSMRVRVLITIALVLVVLASCSSVGPSVDMTPTARLAVDAHVGKGWTADSTRIDNITKDFGPNETVYAAVDMPGSKDGIVKARWMYNGTEVQEHVIPTLEGINVYRFQLDPPPGGRPAGEYTFEVYVNDQKMETESFTVHS